MYTSKNAKGGAGGGAWKPQGGQSPRGGSTPQSGDPNEKP